MDYDSCTAGIRELNASSYQTILRETHVIAFEYDVAKKQQWVSPFIGEYIAGNYDGRLLLDVMMEDDVIHPDDIARFVTFREQLTVGHLWETALRLMTPGGVYRWFRMVMSRQTAEGIQQTDMGLLEDVDMHMKSREQLLCRTGLDRVSGICSREPFFQRTQELLEDEKDKSHFLFCFDIDRFKLINKLFGNEEGNKVLRHVGDILREQTLPGETFGRLNGDVFAVCMGRSQEDTISFINELGRRVQDYPLAFRFFLPTGIVSVSPGCQVPVSELCDWAFLAQHKIKGNYLCPYTFYEPVMGAALEREHELIANMEIALEKGQFLAYFQPKHDMRNGNIIGVEALARWNHPAFGMVSPGEFIPLFERNGFIIKLDEHIWELSCRTIRSWLDRGIEPVPVSVNVSRMHLYNKDFCSRVIELCRKYAVPHHLLELEITESAYTECPQELYPVMDVLQQAGFTFSMDDFGSGYSSLNILKDIPVDIVKFDLRFLGEARKGAQAGESILKNIIQLMKDLKVSILVEGVETENQVKFLRDVDCHYAQGYYYARPMPFDEFELLLKGRITENSKEEDNEKYTNQDNS